MMTAVTHEVDDPDLAIADLREQLRLDGLLARSVGVVSFDAEYIDTGVLKAVCDFLPFDTVGCTTLGNGTDAGSDMCSLCISVLTSDDVQFATGLTGSLLGDMLPISGPYESIRQQLRSDPGLILTFMPLIDNIAGQRIVDRFDVIAKGAPIFGLVACDQDLDNQRAYTMRNGVVSKDRMAFALLSGAVNPRFFVESIPEEKVRKQHAIITKSVENILYEVNNIPALDYMRSLGISIDNGLEGINTIPFIVDRGDGTDPVALSIYLVQGDGGIACGGTIPTGSTLAIGSLDYEDVLSTAQHTVRAAMSGSGHGGMLLYPCMSRCFILGADPNAEMDRIRETAQGIPMQIAYAGGESCPVYSETGRPVNRFHNFSMIICVI